jgi:hypothetical protein
MNLNAKQAIQIAREQFRELMPDLSIDTTDVRLEEIEREGENWAITFSIPNQRNESTLLEGLKFPHMVLGGRVARVIVVDGQDGKLVALRQRAA